MTSRLAFLIIACIGCADLTPPSQSPSQPLEQAASPLAIARCEVRFPVKRRCITQEMSPGEPYVLADPRGLEVVFRVAVGNSASWTRSTRKADARVIDIRALGAQIRADIIQRDAFFVPCDRLPVADGMYWIDLCFTGVPASQCAQTVSATGVGMFQLANQGGAPVISMLEAANDGNVVVSFSPDVTDARCDR